MTKRSENDGGERLKRQTEKTVVNIFGVIFLIFFALKRISMVTVDLLRDLPFALALWSYTFNKCLATMSESQTNLMIYPTLITIRAENNP